VEIVCFNMVCLNTVCLNIGAQGADTQFTELFKGGWQFKELL